MILSFACKETEKLADGRRPRKFPPEILDGARRKLRMLDAASQIDDLRFPPGNRLEALRGNRKGQHGIRINNQWRVCFKWRAGNAHDVEIVDYH